MTSQLRNVLLYLLVLAALALPGPITARASTELRTITGSFTTTNPIYPLIGGEFSAVLYDLAGEIRRDYAFVPAPESQVLGALEGGIAGGRYTLDLPAEPSGTPLDFDGDPASPPAVQVYTSGITLDYLGDAYVNRGETLIIASVAFEPLSQDIVGGRVIVWSAADGELFPAGLGADGNAFTADDPLMPLPAGWSVVALDAEPFAVLRGPSVEVPIIESIGALNDYSALSYRDAWDRFFARVRETYPFGDEKRIDWDAIDAKITPLVDLVENDLTFHLLIARFGDLLVDTHVSYLSVPVLQNLLIGGIGVSGITLTDEGEVVITGLVPNSAATRVGMRVGDVLLAIDGVPAAQALDDTPLLISSASTPHGRAFMQAITLLQGRVGSTVSVRWTGAEGEKRATLTRGPDAAALLTALGVTGSPGRVVEGRMLASGLGYIRVRSFAQEVSAAADLFARALDNLIAAGAPGVIIDVRSNSGGIPQLAMAMAGHFFTDYERVVDFYYADGEGNFDYRGFVEILVSEPHFDGPVAVLVDPMTGSASDVFVYAMTTDQRAIVVGHTPTGGFTGEVSDGQYLLPGALTVQVPTGRPVDPVTGETVLEGVGVAPDVRVPLTRASVLSPEDEVLQAAEAALLDRLGG